MARYEKNFEERRKCSAGVKGGIGPFKCEDYHAQSIDEHVTFQISRRCIVSRTKKNEDYNESRYETSLRRIDEKKKHFIVTRKAETRRID